LLAERDTFWVWPVGFRNADAVRFAPRTTELIPVEKDTVNGPAFPISFAEVQAAAGTAGSLTKEAFSVTRTVFDPCGDAGATDHQMSCIWLNR
jgi:hypothetical protein